MDMRREKATQLAEYLDIDPDEIQLPDTDEPYEEYKTPEGTFTVMTESETEQAFKDEINGFIDECGIGGFTENFQAEIKRDCLDKDELRDVVEETMQFEVDDMSASDVIERAQEHDLIDENLAAEIAECEERDDDKRLDEIADDLRDELVEAMTESTIDDYNGDICQWIVDNFGEESLDHILKENPQMIDRDEIIDRCQEADGYGHSLAHWDGETIETPDFYAFKQDNSDQRSEEFIAEYLCVDKDEVARLNNLKNQSAIDRD